MSQYFVKHTIHCNKSHFILLIIFRRIIKLMFEKNKSVAVTATTGMASTQLGMGATTLHHWCGVMDCRFSQEKLQELMRSDDRFAQAKSRIERAEVLFIDEIGMLSKKVFETVEAICRSVRGNDCTFGGLQVSNMFNITFQNMYRVCNLGIFYIFCNDVQCIWFLFH